MEQVKRKRGRPRKNPLPDELQKLVEETKNLEEAHQGLQEALKLEQSAPQETKKSGEWDVPLGTPIEFFDSNLSYEITGYRPINSTQGLDFDPSWFTEARDTFKTLDFSANHELVVKNVLRLYEETINVFREFRTESDP